MENRAHFIWRQVNIRFTVIALNKAVAISVTRNGAFKFG
jgi:hypothetical protein